MSAPDHSSPLLTIDLGAVARNWAALDALSGTAETAAAVKADAYGCGLEPVARALWRAGCRTFFVATVDEGIRLRRTLGNKAGIFILNGVGTDTAETARTHRLMPCLNAPHQLAAWRAAKGGACALQVDSGMGRLGFSPDDLDWLLDEDEGILPLAVLILSHLACADERDDPRNIAQHRAFDANLARLHDALPTARASLAATGGTLLGAEYHYDLVRCGIGLYGGFPFADAEPVVTLTAPVIQIRNVPPGMSIGYGASWTATRPSRIATLPLGYADGFHRALGKAGRVWIDGRPAPIAGRVSMDLLTVDVTDHPGATENTPVEILGPHQTIDMLATDAQTIGYEMLTALGTRYRRRYKGGEPEGCPPWP